MDGSGHIELQQNEIIPVIFSINLLEGNAFFLNTRMFGDGMKSRDAQKDLGHHITQDHNHAHVKTPPIVVIMTSGGCYGKWSQQKVLVIAHVFPWEVVQRTWFRCHVDS